MTKYVHRVISINTEYDLTSLDSLIGRHPGVESLEKWLNSLGENGWDLVAFLPAKRLNRDSKDLNGSECLGSDSFSEQYAIFRKPAELAEVQRGESIESERLKRRARGRTSITNASS